MQVTFPWKVYSIRAIYIYLYISNVTHSLPKFRKRNLIEAKLFAPWEQQKYVPRVGQAAKTFRMESCPTARVVSNITRKGYFISHYIRV